MIEVELPRSDRYHGPYEVPSTVLFKEFCEGVVRRYGLGGVVRKGKVLRIVPLQIVPLQVPVHTRETGTETETKARGGENQISTKVYEFSVYHTDSLRVGLSPLFSPVRSV